MKKKGGTPGKILYQIGILCMVWNYWILSRISYELISTFLSQIEICCQTLVHHLEKHFDEQGYLSKNWIVLTSRSFAVSLFLPNIISSSSIIYCSLSLNIVEDNRVLNSASFYTSSLITIIVIVTDIPY